MRLIDADSIKFTEYANGDITVSKEKIQNVPTAFDLESVIDQINNAISPTPQYRHRFCENVTVEHCGQQADCEFCVADKIIEILKSAANATNGKNGGRGNGRIEEMSVLRK